MPSTVCLKSPVTVLDDRITKGKSSANRFQAWQVDHERARRSFFKTNEDNQDKFRADLGQNEDNKNAKNSIKAANSNICVEAEKPAGSRVLLAQHPRPSRFSGHDCR